MRRARWLLQLPIIALLASGSTPPAEPSLGDVRRCQGSLGKYGACECLETSVTCINTQFTDTDVFLLVDHNHFKYVTRITFHGNNFVELPFTPLFGVVNHDRLDSLNISANYIVKLHPEALKGMPNLRILDLSNNEIVLKEEDIGFLSHTRKLLRLYLRHAFNQSVNRTIQFELMERMFEDARLDKLTELDLSYNFFKTLPYNLGCHFPSLTHLSLRQNLLETVELNVSCLQRMETLDLRTNLMHTLSHDFRKNFANFLPDYSLVLANQYHCDCNSDAYISWIRSTHKIRDKDSFKCARSSPELYIGTKLMDVPLEKLDCSVKLIADVSSAPSWQRFSIFFVHPVILTALSYAFAKVVESLLTIGG